MTMTQRSSNQVLLIDADDTLWDNAVYFAAARSEFERIIGTCGFPETQAREALRTTEQRYLDAGLYGSRRLIRSMFETADHLVNPVPSSIREELSRTGRDLREHDIRFHICVVPTLAQLAGRQHLHLVTMGDPAEQEDKIRRSGLRRFFAAIDILPDKTIDSYAELLQRRALNRATTWMIGNSLLKDIQPAAFNGLRTVWIPSKAYREVEDKKQSIVPTLHLVSFSHLPLHF